MSSPPELPETRRDIHIQSPVRGSFIEDEKLHASPSTPSKEAIVEDLPSTEVDSRHLPIRNYSRQWWRFHWNQAVKVGLLPRLLYGCIGLCIIGLWVGLTVSFAGDETRWDEDQGLEFNRQLRGREKNNWAVLALEGSLKNFDPIQRTLTVEWSGLWQDYDNPDMKPVALGNGTWPNIAWPMEIYRDTPTTVWISGPSSYYDEGYLRYKITNSSIHPIAVIGMTEDDSFDTTISFKQASPSNDIWKLPLFAYPYDEWQGSISFTTNDPISDRELGINKSHVIAPSGARLKDHTLNWRFNLEPKYDCPWPPNATDVARRFSLSSGADPTQAVNRTFADGNVPCQLKLEFKAQRPPLVKFAAVFSVVVNWTSTFFIFVLTCEVLIMRRGFMLSGTDLLGLTFTSLFALPSVRLLLPGAPEFGAMIDLVGIIPNVIIISLCITAIAVTKLNKRKDPQKEA